MAHKPLNTHYHLYQLLMLARKIKSARLIETASVSFLTHVFYKVVEIKQESGQLTTHQLREKQKAKKT